MDIKFKVSNLKKVLSQMDKLEKDMEIPFQEIVKGGGQLIRTEAIKSIFSTIISYKKLRIWYK